MFNIFKCRKYLSPGSIFHLQGSSFPEPLSEEEEKNYLIKMHEGDEDARNILIEHNLRLVAHIVKKYPSAGESDDLISIGTIGLMKAVNSFKSEKEIKLATYASRHPREPRPRTLPWGNAR